MAEQTDYAYAEAGDRGSSGGSFLGNLATFAIVATTATAGLRYGSKTAASFLTKKFSGMTGKTLGEVGANYLKKTVPAVTESAFARELQAGTKAYQSWSGAWSRMDRIYNNTTYLQEGARHTVSDVTKATNYHFTRMAAQTADFLRRPGLQQRAIGLGVSMAKVSMEGNFAAYIADQGLNIFNRGDQTGPSWYNLPGHALNFAKFSVQTAPYALAFGGGARFLAKSGVQAGIGGLRVARETLAKQPTIERALDRIGKGTEWIFQGLAGVESAIRSAGIRSNSVVPHSMGAMGVFRSLSSPSKYIEASKEYWRGLKGGWTKHRNLSKQVPREAFGNEIMGVLTTAAQVKDSSQMEMFLKDYYTKTQSNRLSGMEYILGLKRKTDFTKELKAAEERAVASLKLPHKVEERDAFVSSFRQGWKRVSDYLNRTGVNVEPGFFTGTKGQTIDLRSVMPQRIRNSVATALDNIGFHIPGQEFFGIEGKIRPAQFFLLPDLLRKTTFQRSENMSAYLGTNRTASLEKGATDRYLGGLIQDGIYTSKSGVKEDAAGIFSAGGFYHLADGNIRRLHSPRMTYKLFSKGAWGLMADTMSWMSGHYPLKREIDEVVNAPGRPFVRRVLDKLDIGLNTDEGVFQRLSGGLKKFTWSEKGGNRHPWQLYQNIRAWESGIGQAAAGSPQVGRDIVEGLDELFMSNIREGSHLRNKAILEHVLPTGFLQRMGDSPNEYKFLLDEAHKVWSGGSGGVHPMVQRLGSEWNLDKIFEMANNVTDYNMLGRLMDDSVATSGRNVYHTLLDTVTLHNMTRNQAGHQVIDNLRNMSEVLMRKGDITKLEAASLRVTSVALKYQEKKTLLQEYLSENGGDILGDKLGNMVNFLKTSTIKSDVETVSKHLYKNPMKDFLLLEETPFVSKYAHYDMTRKEFRNTPFTAVPWGTSGRMSTKELAELSLEKAASDPTPVSLSGEKLTAGKVFYGAATRRFTNLFNGMGLGFNLGSYEGGGNWSKIGGPATELLLKGFMAKRIGVVAGAWLAYNTLDRVLDIMPGLQNTPLGQGATPFIADQVVRARMGLGYLSDVTGITSSAKYLEGLFPGMIDSPLMRFARGVVLPIWAANKIGFKSSGAGKSMASGALAGLAIGGVQGFGLLDMTKNTQELKDIYSGREEVPIRRGRWWEMSSSNYEGGRIRNFQPNWYARLKSQYMDTPDAWGSPFEQMLYKPWPLLDVNPIGLLLGGSHHYAYQHYYSRPYPISNTAFNEMPLIGPTVAATIGRVIAPPKVMHEEELKSALDRYGYAVNGGHTQRAGFIPGTSEMAKSFPVSPYGIRQAVSQQIYNVQQTAGLWGFGTQTAMSELLGMEQPFDGDNVLADAGDITSMRRSYYDRELGGLAGYTELWRRFIPKRHSSQMMVNPLQNRMPKWLPVKFRLGDAYAQTPNGELVLPGHGYSATHNVNMTFPAAAEMLGLSVEDTVRRMLSLGRPAPIGREEVERSNARIKAAAQVYEPYNDVSGTYDGIIRKGRAKILQKVKNLDSQELTDLVGPTETDISEVNFYMRVAGVADGVLQYRIDGVPVMAYPVRYDEQRFQRDMANIAQARKKAAELYAKGVGFEGEAYSHVDRAHVLANVAPWSNEYKAEFAMAKKEVALGRGDKAVLDKIKRQREAIMQTRDLYPRRFLGKVMTPESTYNNMSLNQNIKAGAEYSMPERALGALWEGFNSMNHPFDKFHSYKTPLESYKATMLYGRNLKMWEHPFSHWADAYSKGFMSKDDPMSGYLAGFIGTYTFGPEGLGSAMLGGTIGAAYGAVHGVYRAVRGNRYVPGSMQQIRDINRYFDSMSYYKNMALYDATGKEEYLEEARGTMAGLVPSDLSRESWSRFYRATPYTEKPYIMPFLKETDKQERERIVQYVPDEVKSVLISKWAKMDGLQSDSRISRVSMDKMPAPDWAGWAPDVDLDDIKMITVQNEGFDAHDFGLGWKDQSARIRNSPNLPEPIDMSNPTRSGSSLPSVNQSDIKNLIQRTLSSLGIEGYITVTPSYHDNVVSIIS